MESNAVLEAVSVTKKYPGVVALDGVSFDVRAGEVHVLLGQNGAGKSTLVKVLAGAIQPDEGELSLRGKRVQFRRPIEALEAGIATVHQELTLVPALSVAENTWLGHLPGGSGVISWKELWSRTDALFTRLGVQLDPRAPVRDLGTAQRQLVTIGRALASDPTILMMDEPTSALTARERDNLFGIMNGLIAQGIAILYISHRLEELMHVGTRITVLRDGRRVSTVQKGDVTRADLVRMMVGHEVTGEASHRAAKHDGAPLLKVDGIATHAGLKGVSFDLYPGEILGVAGLMGAGRTELSRALFGLDPLTAGSIEIHGRPVRLTGPKSAIRHGVGLLVEDRRQGLVMPMTVAENVTLADFREVFPGGVLSMRKERELADEAVEYMNIRTPNIWQRVSNLSGGNQQKVALARWMCTQSDILILDEPTRGVDVGAKEEIYKLLEQLAKRGAAILFIVSEFPELQRCCNRALVMFGGRIVGELGANEMTQAQVLALATGGGE